MDDLGVTVGVVAVVAILFAVASRPFLRLAGPVAYVLWCMVGAGMVAFVTGEPWAAVFIASIGVAALLEHRKAARRQLEQAHALIRLHAHQLAIRRAQLVHRGAYGVIDRKRWDQEIGRFIVDVLEPAIGAINPLASICSKVRDAIEAAAAGTAAATAFRSDLNPIEYEQLVADTLRRLGWDAQTTRASGDQGIDVLAVKGPLRVVLQCKLYSRAVGNEAVQQAIAGQRFEQATHAAVVSNAAFTRSALELASAAGVLLLHHEQLGDLDQLAFAPQVRFAPRGAASPLTFGAA